MLSKQTVVKGTFVLATILLISLVFILHYLYPSPDTVPSWVPSIVGIGIGIAMVLLVVYETMLRRALRRKQKIGK